MKIRKVRARVAGPLALAACLSGGLTVGLAGTANAATPECRGVTTFHDQDPGDEYNKVPTTAPNSYDWRCILGIGDGYVGDQAYAVQILQQALRKCYSQYLGPSGDDGKYGTYTYNAVKNVQHFHNVYGNAGLVEDGKYGPKTAEHMEFPNSRGVCWTLT